MSRGANSRVRRSRLPPYHPVRPAAICARKKRPASCTTSSKLIVVSSCSVTAPVTSPIRDRPHSITPATGTSRYNCPCDESGLVLAVRRDVLKGMRDLVHSSEGLGPTPPLLAQCPWGSRVSHVVDCMEGHRTGEKRMAHRCRMLHEVLNRRFDDLLQIPV
jgi:hypothetical protein